MRDPVGPHDMGAACAEPEPEPCGSVACDALLEVTSMGVVEERFRARGFPFVRRIKLECGLVWDRCGSEAAPAADDFFMRQMDAWADGGGALVDPDGGLDDDYDDALVASWGAGAWDDADVC